MESLLRPRRPDEVLSQALREEVKRAQPSRRRAAGGDGDRHRQRGRVSRGSTGWGSNHTLVAKIEMGNLSILNTRPNIPLVKSFEVHHLLSGPEVEVE